MRSTTSDVDERCTRRMPGGHDWRRLMAVDGVGLRRSGCDHDGDAMCLRWVCAQRV